MTDKQFQLIVKSLLALSFLLLGLSFFLGQNARAIEATFSFYSLTSLFETPVLGKIAGATLIAVAIAILTPHERAKTLAFWGMMLIAAVPLLTLLSETRWVAVHGGFPVIGSGQGIIKYFAILPLAFYLFKPQALTERQQAWFNWATMAMVLFWIGGVKFFEYEAKAIEGLLVNSPLMSWLYDVFSLQGASNAIGSYDIAFALLLALGMVLGNKKIMWTAGIACGAVFGMTQTFLITSGGFDANTVINGLGQFVIKDLWYIANLVVIAQFLAMPKRISV
ncbi:YkgB family protein [Psychrobium sp. MM17-31]|uniref:DUF417 family protein n=1 Tax=Psychrobium sp. MM17-31 TaxID=2917758 RepID=UPI001EF5ED52|nr:DUF417 family protein [Psychrobium sp. MM17-31]MCG7530776.1 YkgB family protein [Psychrobium sp. MM17-31]